MNGGSVRDEERLTWRLRAAGVNRVDYDLALKTQDGRCAICGYRPRGRPLAIDHDHERKLFRGLLCTSCNLGLGSFRDSPDLLECAIKYLSETVNGPMLIKPAFRLRNEEIYYSNKKKFEDALMGFVSESGRAYRSVLSARMKDSGIGRNSFEMILSECVKSGKLVRGSDGRRAYFSLGSGNV